MYVSTHTVASLQAHSWSLLQHFMQIQLKHFMDSVDKCVSFYSIWCFSHCVPFVILMGVQDLSPPSGVV